MSVGLSWPSEKQITYSHHHNIVIHFIMIVFYLKCDNTLPIHSNLMTFKNPTHRVRLQTGSCSPPHLLYYLLQNEIVCASQIDDYKKFSFQISNVGPCIEHPFLLLGFQILGICQNHNPRVWKHLFMNDFGSRIHLSHCLCGLRLIRS